MIRPQPADGASPPLAPASRRAIWARRLEVSRPSRRLFSFQEWRLRAMLIGDRRIFDPMNTPLAIIVGAVLIAASILLANRWAALSPSAGLGAAIRLDRWTGAMTLCTIDASSLKGTSVAGLPLECRPQ